MQVNLKLSLAEVYQLRAYARDRDEGNGAGWYYGDKEYFEKRHKSIMSKLDRVIDAVKDRATE